MDDEEEQYDDAPDDEEPDDVEEGSGDGETPYDDEALQRRIDELEAESRFQQQTSGQYGLPTGLSEEGARSYSDDLLGPVDPDWFEEGLNNNPNWAIDDTPRAPSFDTRSGDSSLRFDPAEWPQEDTPPPQMRPPDDGRPGDDQGPHELWGNGEDAGLTRNYSPDALNGANPLEYGAPEREREERLRDLKHKLDRDEINWDQWSAGYNAIWNEYLSQQREEGGGEWPPRATDEDLGYFGLAPDPRQYDEGPHEEPDYGATPGRRDPRDDQMQELNQRYGNGEIDWEAYDRGRRALFPEEQWEEPPIEQSSDPNGYQAQEQIRRRFGPEHYPNAYEQEGGYSEFIDRDLPVRQSELGALDDAPRNPSPNWIEPELPMPKPPVGDGVLKDPILPPGGMREGDLPIEAPGQGDYVPQISPIPGGYREPDLPLTPPLPGMRPPVQPPSGITWIQLPTGEWVIAPTVRPPGVDY